MVLIEHKHLIGFGGLLITLEKYSGFLAEKQDNTTYGMNESYFDFADYARYNDTEDIFLADSWNESKLMNCSMSLQAAPPDSKNYHLYLNTLTPVSPSPSPPEHSSFHAPVHDFVGTQKKCTGA